MPIFGHARPIIHVRAFARLTAVLALFLASTTAAVPCARAAEINVRLRFAWGSGGQSPLKWTGKITAAGARLTDLQPLGVEADEAAALRLDGEQILITPLVRRAFDGCDVTIRADEATPVKIELEGSASSPPKTIEAPLSQLVAAQYRSPLDDFGGFLLVNRAPGDILRVHFDRQHLVFQPGEPFELKLDADLKAEAAKGPITIDARLISADGNALWQTSKSYDATSAAPIPLQLNVPAAEGAYRLRLIAQHPEGFADRLVPWEKQTPIATRDVDLVVIDPKHCLPRLTNNWELVSTIDPANSSWWQRLPQWSALDKLPAFNTPRPLGNVKPLTVPNSRLNVVELPLISSIPEEPSWQAYMLPVRHVGEPYAVEIELPRDVAQHVAVSIIEPDAAGHVLSFGRDAGFYRDDHFASLTSSDAAGTIAQRIVFWPRTRLPALLIANRSVNNPVRYGKIRLLHRAVEAQPAIASDEDPTAPLKSERLVAAYLGSPDFVKTLGAAEELDIASGLSVSTWNTFLQGANRLAQELRADGYNAAIITIAADGGSLAPIDSLGASPRFDTGRLAATGADPISKDVLEALLRVFDREGLRLIPAVQLSTPLPGLEAVKQSATEDTSKSALAWIGADGRPLTGARPADAAVAPHYNVLAPQVQHELTAIADQLLQRYGGHRALAGLALRLSGAGYGVLPGLACGFDDDTVNRFAAGSKVELPQEGADRFQKRAALLLGPRLVDWKRWRAAELTEFYTDLASRIASKRPGLQLVLTTADLFSGPAAEQRLRQAVSGRGMLDDAAKELGLDLRRLAAAPNVTLLRARRLNADESINSRALDLRLNAAVELDHALSASPRSGDLIYHTSTQLRLPSFDAQGPFGGDRTYLALASPSFPLAEGALQSLASALAVRDFTTLANGADMLPLAENDVQAAAFRTFRELPVDCTDVHVERREPVTVRIYRERESTTICLINESPWPADVALPLQCAANIVWRQLGEPKPLNPNPTSANPASAATGSFSGGAQRWTAVLPPYGIQARRFSSPTIQVGSAVRQVAAGARTDLARRIALLEERMPNINVERAYEQLKNPSFELAGDSGRPLGWQSLVGKAGQVEIAVEPPPESGGPARHCVHLRSEDALGVAVQSQLFPIPATGQLLIRAKARADEAAPDARLYARVEYQQSGVMQPPRYTVVGTAETLGEEWKEVEFALDDLPMASNGQMRIQFHLAGTAAAWVDDVRLYDLCFSGAQRIELAKRLYAAKTALEEGQLLDCQRLVDGYWPRRLVEQVPAAAIASRPAEPASTAPAEEPQQKGLGARVRGMVPKILR